MVPSVFELILISSRSFSTPGHLQALRPDLRDQDRTECEPRYVKRRALCPRAVVSIGLQHRAPERRSLCQTLWIVAESIELHTR